MTAGRADAPMVEVRMPQLGESVDEGTITRWFKAPGERVGVDEPLYEVSSDKATMEIPSLVAGYVRAILVEEGATVSVGSVVAEIGAKRERLSPVVRRLLREHGLDAASVGVSAENGRITKNDVLARVAAARDAPAPPVTPMTPVTPEAPEMPATAALSEAQPTAVSQATPATADLPQRMALSAMRLRASERLGAAQKSAVNVFSVVEIDLETVALERARRGFTFLPFIARATIDALRVHPVLNASLDEASALVCHDDVHLGIAVDLAEAGLVVPVVRYAQRLTLEGLATEIARLADGARNAKLRPDDYAGPTFTISNNGAFGTLMTAPVINPPNVAIVSTDAVELRPVVIDRMIAIRHRMYFCMTWDHRAFDGSTAGKFLARVKSNLETWNWSTQ